MTGIAQEWLARAGEALATVEKLLDDDGVDQCRGISCPAVY